MYCLPILHSLFFFNDTATTEIYTLSLHDALPIFRRRRTARYGALESCDAHHEELVEVRADDRQKPHARQQRHRGVFRQRSEEHTSELQSPCNLVCRLLLEKKKKITQNQRKHSVPA